MYKTLRAGLGPFVLTAYVAGCSGNHPTATSTKVTAEVASASIQATQRIMPTASWLSFQIPVTIVNSGPDTVYVAPCGGNLEQQQGNSWQTVWSPECAAILGPSIVVAPDSAVQRTISVDAALSGNGEPQWNAPSVAGQYRFVTGVFTAPQGSSSAQLVPLEQRTTNVFVVAAP